MNDGNEPRIVIIGGGFGGLYAAKRFEGASVQVTLIDRRNFHLFQPLLYQVATGSLSPGNIASPLRRVFRQQPNVTVLLGEVTDIDLETRRVLLAEGSVDYDYLIVAAGSRHDYFSHDEWEQYAPGLKTVEDATELRSRIFAALEHADAVRLRGEPHPAVTFVVVGAGPTGVELTGAIADILHDTLGKEYRALGEGAARVVLLDAADRVLPGYAASLSRNASEELRRRGVAVRTKTLVKNVDRAGVDVETEGQRERIDAALVVWAAGVRASKLGQRLAEAEGESVDRQGRVKLAPSLHLRTHPEVYVVGDLARVEYGGTPLPAIASVAMQQGAYVADSILATVRGAAVAPFRYHDYGTMATIGRNAAVADLRGLKLTGFLGWATWLFVHLMKLAGFENRLLVLTQWAWSYLRRSRSARLITGEEARRPVERGAAEADAKRRAS